MFFPFIGRLATYSTKQYGFAADFGFPLQRSLALMFRGQIDYRPLARDESDICHETRCRLDARFDNATGMMIQGAALLGFELHPAIAEVSFYDLGPIELSLVFGAGLGAASTRRQLRRESDAGPATFGDTGWRFATQFGGGLRFRVGRWVSVRVELRDLVFSSAITTVSGCSQNDLRLLDVALRAGVFRGSEAANPSCHIAASDVPIAYAYMKVPHVQWLHNVQLHAGLGLTF